VHLKPVGDEADLMQRLTDTWNGLSQSIVDGAVDEWSKIFQSCVYEKGTLAAIFRLKCKLIVWINLTFF